MMGSKREAPKWVTDPQAATPSLAEFLEWCEDDDNIWWEIGCGHHQNLLLAALDERDEAREEVRILRADLGRLRKGVRAAPEDYELAEEEE